MLTRQLTQIFTFAAVLLCTISAAAEANLLKNSDFKRKTAGWSLWRPKNSKSTVTIVKDSEKPDKFIAVINCKNKSGVLMQLIPVKEGGKYKISAKAMTKEPAAGALLSIRWLSPKKKFIDTNNNLTVKRKFRLIPNMWGQEEFEIVVPKGAGFIYFMLSGSGKDMSVSFKDLFVYNISNALQK